jgi:hypothetical protein
MVVVLAAAVIVVTLGLVGYFIYLMGGIEKEKR